MDSTTVTESTLQLITRFEEGFNKRDADALMRDMTDDCIFEHVAPEGSSFGRYQGQAEVKAVWESLEEHFPGYDMRIADIFAAGDRAACRWEMTWNNADGTTGSMRGVDVFRVRDGKIAEKLMYGTL